MHAGAVRDGALHAHDAILEMLNLHEGGMQKLAAGKGDKLNGQGKKSHSAAS